jgi:hypothetical protein
VAKENHACTDDFPLNINIYIFFRGFPQVLSLKNLCFSQIFQKKTWLFPQKKSWQGLGCCLWLRGQPLETWLGTSLLEYQALFIRAVLGYCALCHLD